VKVAIDTVQCMLQGSPMVPSSESVVAPSVEGIDRMPNGNPGVVLDITTGR
jgi:predicted ribosome-associated RNA-binding protein Tma20